VCSILYRSPDIVYIILLLFTLVVGVVILYVVECVCVRYECELSGHKTKIFCRVRDRPYLSEKTIPGSRINFCIIINIIYFSPTPRFPVTLMIYARSRPKRRYQVDTCRPSWAYTIRKANRKENFWNSIEYNNLTTAYRGLGNRVFLPFVYFKTLRSAWSQITNRYCVHKGRVSWYTILAKRLPNNNKRINRYDLWNSLLHMLKWKKVPLYF